MLEGIVGPAGTGRGAEEGAAAAADLLAIRTHQRDTAWAWHNPHAWHHTGNAAVLASAPPPAPAASLGNSLFISGL